MRKIFIAVLGVLFFAPAVFADNWGLGFKAGVGQKISKNLILLLLHPKILWKKKKYLAVWKLCMNGM